MDDDDDDDDEEEDTVFTVTGSPTLLSPQPWGEQGSSSQQPGVGMGMHGEKNQTS